MRTLRGIVDEISLRGDVLVVGDSATAYCVDSMIELLLSALRGGARDDCGCVNFYFESWPGATPRSFFHMRLMLPGGVALMIGYS